MKNVFSLIIISFFLGACCYPSPKTPTISVKKEMKLVTDTLQETSDAVDILSDDSLSVEERVQLYQERMEKINKRFLLN